MESVKIPSIFAGKPDIEELPPSGAGTKLCTGVLMFISIIFLIATFPFSLIYVIKVIPVYERGVIFRLGRIKGGKASGPGLVYLLPCLDKIINVDTRLKTFDVPPQSVSRRLCNKITIVICFFFPSKFIFRS